MCFCRGEAAHSRILQGLFHWQTRVFVVRTRHGCVDECLSPGSKHCDGTIALRRVGVVLLPPISFLLRQGLSTTCSTRLSRGLFCCNRRTLSSSFSTFFGPFVSHIFGLVFAFDVLVFALFALAFALLVDCRCTVVFS